MLGSNMGRSNAEAGCVGTRQLPVAQTLSRHSLRVDMTKWPSETGRTLHDNARTDTEACCSLSSSRRGRTTQLLQRPCAVEENAGDHIVGECNAECVPRDAFELLV